MLVVIVWFLFWKEETSMTMINDRYEELKHAERGALLSIVTYLFIATLKLIVANYSGSSALRADGLNNTTDTILQ